jgi:hypothetical protein
MKERSSMKPRDIDTLYDNLESDSQLDNLEIGPFECDECKELYAPDATNLCNWCGMTVCDACWGRHEEAHIEKEVIQ